MSEDRRTKAQLIAALEQQANEFNRLIERNSELHSQVAAQAVPDVAEASALAGCIRALDPIAKTRRDGYGFSQQQSSREVEHVVRHLVGRYGLDLVERTMIPCDRRHLDEANDAELIERLRGYKTFVA